MRVLHVHSGNLFAGVETLLVALARHRDVCPAMRPGFALCFAGRLASELTELGRPPAILGAVRIRRPWTIVRARRRLAGVLRRERSEAVVFHGPWPYALFGGVVRRSGPASVVWLHGPLRRAAWLDRLATRVPPDLVLCNSRFTERSLDAFAGPPRSAVVYPPLTMPPDPPDDRESSRAALGAPPGTVVLVQVGRLDPMKGNREHLEALALLRDVPGWVSWHVGGPQSAAQRRHLRELQAAVHARGLNGRVRFLGERRDVARVLRAGDIYVQPNTSPDAFGLSFVEAMLARLPVVTSGCGGALEVVDGSCGVLVPPADVVALAGALRELLVDGPRRLALGAAGPARARALCDPSRQLAALDAALARVRRAGGSAAASPGAASAP
jgi:glycosyltransferase involved in cell wall biosynthesis